MSHTEQYNSSADARPASPRSGEGTIARPTRTALGLTLSVGPTPAQTQ
jgi:hypothetical protein